MTPTTFLAAGASLYAGIQGEQSTLNALAKRVQTFEHWVYKQCLSIIDGFVQEQVYSATYKLAYPLPY